MKAPLKTAARLDSTWAMTRETTTTSGTPAGKTSGHHGQATSRAPSSTPCSASWMAPMVPMQRPSSRPSATRFVWAWAKPGSSAAASTPTSPNPNPRALASHVAVTRRRDFRPRSRGGPTSLDQPTLVEHFGVDPNLKGHDGGHRQRRADQRGERLAPPHPVSPVGRQKGPPEQPARCAVGIDHDHALPRHPAELRQKAPGMLVGEVVQPIYEERLREVLVGEGHGESVHDLECLPGRAGISPGRGGDEARVQVDAQVRAGDVARELADPAAHVENQVIRPRIQVGAEEPVGELLPAHE